MLRIYKTHTHTHIVYPKREKICLVFERTTSTSEIYQGPCHTRPENIPPLTYKCCGRRACVCVCILPSMPGAGCVVEEEQAGRLCGGGAGGGREVPLLGRRWGRSSGPRRNISGDAINPRSRSTRLNLRLDSQHVSQRLLLSPPATLERKRKKKKDIAEEGPVSHNQRVVT